MKRSRIVAMGCLALAALLLPMQDAFARTAGDLGIGLYQGAAVRTFRLYPSFNAAVTDEFILGFGLNFGTQDSQSFGFYSRASYAFRDDGFATINLGGSIEVLEAFNSTGAVFAPLVGVEFEVNSAVTFVLDAYPLMISTIGETEVLFLEGRIGATWWF